MAIFTDEVNRIAKLARLDFNDEQKQKLLEELSAILDYVDQLKEVESKASLGILSAKGGTASGGNPDAINLMRDDVAEELTPPEEFLKQAPAREGNFVKVKSILE